MGDWGSTERLVELLGQAEDLFGGSHALQEYFRGVCEILVPSLADWCEISLVTDGKLVCQAAKHIDPAAQAAAVRMLDSHPRDLIANDGAPRAIRERTPLLHAPLPSSVLTGIAHDPNHLSGLQKFAINSTAYVPLTVRDRAIGALSLANSHDRPLLTHLDLTLAKAIAARTAAAVENARLIEAERREREQAEAALISRAAAEARLSAIADHTNALIYIVDLEGRFIFANRAYSEAVGVADVPGRSTYDLFPLETARKFAEEDRQVAAAGRAMQFDEDVPINGDLRSYVTTLFPLRDGDGRTVIGGISTDVTERKRLDQALKQAQKMELVGRVDGGIAHEYNNLFTIIAGNCELALPRAGDDPEQLRSLERILRSTQRGAHLTHRLLVFARRQVRQTRIVNVNAVVEELWPSLAEILGPGFALAPSLDADLPSVRCDPNEMKDVITSLVLNARDAMPGGGALRITTSSSDGMVRLEVADSGCGMSEAVRARVFEPFFTTKSPGEGVGLGLSTALAVIEECGGRIDVESWPGAGTRVRIELPAALASTSTSSSAMS
jgi:PAS domain S-box-containing protein